MKKGIFVIVFIFISALGGFLFGRLNVPSVLGAGDAGKYVNIYGSGYVDCEHPGGNCNSLYIADNNYCSPDAGTCSGDRDKDVWALKLTCDGFVDAKECGNGHGTMVKPGEWSRGTLNVSSGTACNQTVQIDVFDKKCDANGTWDSSCNLLGYMVWYSGACPVETPTPPPACNTDCTGDPSICQQAGGGCTSCVDNGSGRKTCQVPPTATPPGDAPTATPPGDAPTATPPIDRPTATPPVDRPTATPPGDAPTATPRPPTATPTPDFSEAMCTCDGMTASQIIAGQPAVFTAISKVKGSDVTKAEAKQIEFSLFMGNNPSNRKVIAGPERVNTTSSGGTNEVSYQAQWTVNIPAAVEKNVDYLARATIKCTRKTTAHAYPYTAMVLAESDSKGIFAIIADFFRNLFSRNTETVEQSDAPQDSQVSVQDDFVSVAERNNLQLGSFAPAKVIENVCPTVKFRFQ